MVEQVLSSAPLLELMSLPLLPLLLAIVIRLANALQVRRIIEQPLVTAMRPDMVNDWTVCRRVLADTQHACLLAGVMITCQDLTSQRLPA